MKGSIKFTERELAHLKGKLGTHHFSVVMDHYNWFLYWERAEHLSNAIRALTDLTVDPPKQTKK